MSNITFIVGPTAVGKTEVAYQLAKKINPSTSLSVLRSVLNQSKEGAVERIKAEIVSADSMLFYKEASIITSRPPEYILRSIPHYFIGNISVKDSYSVFDYFTESSKLISDLHRKNIPLIVCGGSGLYVKALLDGIFGGAGEDKDLRKKLEGKAKEFGKEYLREELRKVDPETAEKVKDLRRIIRALEVYRLTGVPLSQKKKEAKGLWGKLPIKIFGLRMKKESLRERIDKRVENMFSCGAVDEVKKLLRPDLSPAAEKIIGIKEIAGFLNGEYDIETAKELMKQATRQLAKRQMTWFRADKRINWIDIDTFAAEEAADKMLKDDKQK